MLSLIKSFGFALEGIVDALVLERNFRIEWLAGLMVFLLASLFDFGLWETAILVLLVFLVLSLELLNTAIEKICDSSGIAFSENKKRAKDYGAASVLLTAIAAAIIFFGILDNQAETLFIHVMKHGEAYFLLASIFVFNTPMCFKKVGFWPFLSAFIGIFMTIFFFVQFSHRPFFIILAGIFQMVLIISYLRLFFFLPQIKKSTEAAHE